MKFQYYSKNNVEHFGGINPLLVLNHNYKTFECYNKIFDDKKYQDLVEILNKYPEYIGKITIYGGHFTVKKVKDINITPFYSVDDSYISSDVLGCITYLINDCNLCNCDYVMQAMLDLIIKEHIKTFNSVGFSGFELNSNNIYVNQKLAEFLYTNSLLDIIDDNELNKLNFMKNTDLLQITKEVFAHLMSFNPSTIGDLETYYNNQIKVSS